MNNLKIYALGGLDENGKNIYCIEIEDKIVIVDCGIKRSDTSAFGIDYVIPDFTYLVKNKERIVCLIITNLHDDMMDAVPYLIKEINIPIYAPKLCCSIIENDLKASGINSYRLFPIERDSDFTVKGIKFQSFALTSSTPESIGLSIDTPKGKVVFAAQFVVDFNITQDAFRSNIGRIAEIGKEGVLCAMIESCYSDRVGFTAPKHRILNYLNNVFEDAKGRIFIMVYGQNYFRLKEIFDTCSKFNRRIYFYDEKNREYLEILEKNGVSMLPKNMVIKPENFNNDIDDCVVLVTGFGSRIFTGMYKIATGEDDNIELRESDTVVIASPIVSGTEKEGSSMENELYKDNVHIIKFDPKEVLSAHPSSEDIKMMLSILRPTYFLPVMGTYRSFVNAADMAMQVGYTPDKIIILDNGQVATFADGKLKSCAEVLDEIGETLINEENKKNITSFVLKDREMLSTDGVIIIGVAVDYKTKQIIAGPDIQSRGVIYVKDSEYLIKNIGKTVCELIENKVYDGTYNNLDTRAELKDMISRYVFRETGKKPMILPAIIEINI